MPIVAGRAPKARHPQFARLDEDGDRLYRWRGEGFYSVTTQIGGGIPKPYLNAHYAKMAAELAYTELMAHGPHSRSSAIARRLAKAGRAWVEQLQADGLLTSIKLAKLSDRDLGLRWIKGAADRHRDAAAELGIEVHDEAEALVLQHARASVRLYIAGAAIEPWPAHLAGHMKSFTDWLDDWHPEFVATEATVFNRREAYAGTLDAIVLLRVGDLVAAVERNGQPVPLWLASLDPEQLVLVIVDYKSGNRIYPEVAQQLAAYARSEFVAGADGITEYPMPAVVAGAALHLTPTGYRFGLVRIDDEIFDAFRYTREVYRWRKELSRTAFLEDLSPAKPKKEVARP
jgi:hypothetical protein